MKRGMLTDFGIYLLNFEYEIQLLVDDTSVCQILVWEETSCNFYWSLEEVSNGHR